MNRFLMGVCAFALAVALPAPAKAGGFGESFAGGLVGGAVGGIIGNAISQPRYRAPPIYRYGYQPPPPPVYVQPAPVYVTPNWCGATMDSYGNYCNVYACAKKCNGYQSGYNSFRLSDCSYNPGGGYGRRRCTK